MVNDTTRKGITALITAMLFSLPHLSIAQDSQLFERPDNDYTLSVRAENMVARVHLNGAQMMFHAKLDPVVLTLGVDQFVRHGENTLTIDFEPINPEAKNYSPNDGVKIRATMRQGDNNRARNIVDLFNGRYSSETKRMEALNANLLTGDDLIPQAGTLTVLPNATVTPVDMNYSDRDSGEFARRLTVSFQINDPSALTPPFEGAPVLSDTPEMRDKLYDAYARFYTAHANNDRALYGAQMSEVINRFAYVRGYKGREEKALDATLSGPPLSGREGEELRPLPSRSAFQTAHLSFGSEGRMVRASDHPIMYVSSETSKKIAGVGVFFCMGTDGEMFVCHQPLR